MGVKPYLSALDGSFDIEKIEEKKKIFENLSTSFFSSEVQILEHTVNIGYRALQRNGDRKYILMYVSIVDFIFWVSRLNVCYTMNIMVYCSASIFNTLRQPSAAQHICSCGSKAT